MPNAVCSTISAPIIAAFPLATSIGEGVCAVEGMAPFHSMRANKRRGTYVRVPGGASGWIQPSYSLDTPLDGSRPTRGDRHEVQGGRDWLDKDEFLSFEDKRKADGDHADDCRM